MAASASRPQQRRRVIGDGVCHCLKCKIRSRSRSRRTVLAERIMEDFAFAELQSALPKPAQKHEEITSVRNSEKSEVDSNEASVAVRISELPLLGNENHGPRNLVITVVNRQTGPPCLDSNLYRILQDEEGLDIFQAHRTTLEDTSFRVIYAQELSRCAVDLDTLHSKICAWAGQEPRHSDSSNENSL